MDMIRYMYILTIIACIAINVVTYIFVMLVFYFRCLVIDYYIYVFKYMSVMVAAKPTYATTSTWRA